MINRVLFVIIVLLISQIFITGEDFCIEPRNSYAEDNIADLQWSTDDLLLYISIMGQVNVHELKENNNSLAFHQVCEGRFPVIEITELYYAIGSDFLPIVSIYDTKTHRLINEFNTMMENVRSIDFNETDDIIVVSTSNYDDDGFFDIDRNIEVWDFQTDEILAQFVQDEENNPPYLPFNTQVVFLSPDTVLVAGVDQEDAFVLTQPYVYIWNWRTGDVEQVDTDANTLIEVLDFSALMIIGSTEDEKISIQPVSLLPSFKYEQQQVYDIKIEDLSSIRFSANTHTSVLAVENKDGFIWIIDFDNQEILLQRDFGRAANSIALDHAGQYLALGYQDGVIEVWDIISDTTTVVDVVFSQ